MTQPSAGEGVHATTTKITDRHPAYAGQVEQVGFELRKTTSDIPTTPQTVAVARKGNLQSETNCSEQTWPRIAEACLSSGDEARMRDVRMVSISNDLGSNTSVVMRTAPTVTAAR